MATIADLPIGAKIKFGSYAVRGRDPHKICWLKAHRDNTIMTEFLEDCMPFDAAEPDASGARAKGGSNHYATSNIRQFLNSCGENWWLPGITKEDTPPKNEYVYQGDDCDKKPGFLSKFAAWEVGAIEPTLISTTLPKIERDKTGEMFEETVELVYLPSYNEILYNNQAGFDLFREGHCTTFCMTPDCYDRAKDRPDNRDHGWFFHLRDPFKDSDTDVVSMSHAGVKTTLEAYDAGVGFLACLRLKADTPVSEDPDVDGYFYVLDVPEVFVDIDEAGFIELLAQI